MHLTSMTESASSFTATHANILHTNNTYPLLITNSALAFATPMSVTSFPSSSSTLTSTSRRRNRDHDISMYAHYPRPRPEPQYPQTQTNPERRKFFEKNPLTSDTHDVPLCRHGRRRLSIIQRLFILIVFVIPMEAPGLAFRNRAAAIVSMACDLAESLCSTLPFPHHELVALLFHLTASLLLLSP